jgi:O-antigen/teichoic acid export membrane protein
MSVVKKALTDSFFLATSNVTGRFISFLAVLIMTRALSLADYGAIVLALTVSGPMQFLSSFGLEGVVISDMARFRGEQQFSKVKSLLWSYTTVKLFCATALVVISWFLKPYLVQKFGIIVNEYYYILTIWAYLNLFYNIFDITLNAHEKFKILAVADVTEIACKSLFIGIFWFLGIISIKWALLAYVFSKAIGTIIIFFGTLRATSYLKKIPLASERVYRDMVLHHGKWDVFSQTIIQQLDGAVRPWVVRWFIGVEGVALFSVARSVYNAIMGAVPVKQIIFPLVARNIADKEKNVLIAQKATKYSFLIYFAISIAAFFLISPFINIFFPKYISSILLFRILLLRLLVTAAGYGQSAFFYAYREQRSLFAMGFIDILGLFTSLPLFLHIFGLPGVYLEKIFLLIIVYIVRETYLRRKLGIVTWRFKALIEYDQYDKDLIKKLMGGIKSFLWKKKAEEGGI